LITKSKSDYNGLFGSIKETDQLLFFSMRTTVSHNGLYHVYYSKETGNILSSFVFMAEEDFLGFPKTGYGSWIVSEHPVENLISWKDRILEKKAIPTNDRIKAKLSLAEGLTWDDNSVLMFYKLKPF